MMISRSQPLHPKLFQNKDVAVSPSNIAKIDTSLWAAALDKTSATSYDAVREYIKSRGVNRTIRKVFIANNGMAASKSIFSIRQWVYMELDDKRAIQFVAMATPEDLKANAELHCLADTFVKVPNGKNLINYLNVVIVKIAQEPGVDAVWPGWGHVSENPKLPNTLDNLGIKFIEPTGPVMSVLGDKIAANILAQTAKVPSIPCSGSFGGIKYFFLEQNPRLQVEHSQSLAPYAAAMFVAISIMIFAFGKASRQSKIVNQGGWKMMMSFPITLSSFIFFAFLTSHDCVFGYDKVEDNHCVVHGSIRGTNDAMVKPYGIHRDGSKITKLLKVRKPTLLY